MQYGFRYSRSTDDLLSYLTERISRVVSRVLDRQDERRSVALDIVKSFDKVWHQDLLHKLLSYGITGPLHLLLASFLKDRQMSVVLDGQKFSTSTSTPVSGRAQFWAHTFPYLPGYIKSFR